MHVAIDARIPGGYAGGVAQVVLGLAEGFRNTSIPDLTRTWIVYPGAENWLVPHLPAGDDVWEVQTLVERLGLSLAARAPRVVSTIRPHLERVLAQLPGAGAEGPLDAQLRQRGVEVVHLPFQDGLSTELPSLYQPHDLQHRYLPNFFTRAQLRHRESAWRSRAERAAAVVVGTDEVADDVVRFWGVDRSRVHTVPLAPVSQPAMRGTDDTGAARQVLYPAAFWPHKNHVTLVRAVGLLRDRGVDVALRLPGAHVGDYPTVRRAVVEAGLDPGETLPGYVSDQQLDELYESSMLVVVPSKFESASFPIWEAFLRSKPVVAARTTALPRQVGDGGLVVDADDAPGFAEAIERLLADSALRDDMGAAGRAWASQFTWDRTVLATTALYRHVLGRQPRPAEWVALRSDVKI